MGSKISVQIERALLGKSSDVGISALGIDSGGMTGYSEAIHLDWPALHGEARLPFARNRYDRHFL